MFEFDVSVQMAVVRSVLATRGVAPALALLNDRTDFRFTGMYRLDGELMHAAHVFDRLGEHRAWLSAVPLGRSFCRYVLANGEFHTSAASQDSRLAAHPYAGLVESYYGRLLHRQDGTPWGTLIHFDLDPRALPPQEAGFLEGVVPLFSEYLE